MVEPTVVVSSHSVDVCVERLCRLAARSGYRVSRRRRVTDIFLSDPDVDRESSGRYVIRFRARCRQFTWNSLGGRVFLTIVGRLTALDKGTEMAVTVRPGAPFLRRDRMTQIVGYAVSAVGLIAWLIAAIVTGDSRLWQITGAYVLTLALFVLLAGLLFRQATGAITALLASAISAPLAGQDEARVTLST